MYNPIPPLFFLAVLSIPAIPLILLATVTTTLAFSMLFLRAVLVYIDLGLALVTNYLFPFSQSRPVFSTTVSKPPSSYHIYQRTLRQRRQSSSSGITVQYEDGPTSTSTTPRRAASGIFGLGALGSSRDFEGVGGWRFTTPAEDQRDEDVWMSLNSRLQLPTAPAAVASSISPGGTAAGRPSSSGARTPSAKDKDRPRVRKQHRRSATSGSLPSLKAVGNKRSSTPDDLGMAPLVRDDRTPDELSMEEGFFDGSGRKARNDELRAAIMGGDGSSPSADRRFGTSG